MILASLFDQKCLLCSLVSKSNVTLAQPLRLKIPYFLNRKILSGDRRLYLNVRNRTFRSDADRLALTKQLLNLFCIVYFFT